MATLALHPQTAAQLKMYEASPAHAVLVVGSAGSGKLTLARQLVTSTLGSSSSPYILTIESEAGKAIGIETIRELEQFLSLKVPSKQAYNRAIIIADAHQMTTEAQNAFLKTLEEPPRGTIIIMTATDVQAVLPTIRSRSQAITVNRPERSDLEVAFNAFDAVEVSQAYAVSGGLPGLMHALLTDVEHPLAQAVAQARMLLSGSAYERLLAVDELSKQRENAANVTFILQQMAHVSLQTASGAAAKRWQNVLQASYEASEALATSAQPKLVLTQLMLAL